MSFAEVVDALKNGKKVRRACWPEGIYIKRQYDDVIEIDDLSPPYTTNSGWFCPGDLIEDDWEIINF